MSDEFYKAMAIIIPSFFGLVITVTTAWIAYKTKQNTNKIEVLHKTINSGLTVQLESELQKGIYKGVLKEKADQKVKEANQAEGKAKEKEDQKGRDDSPQIKT